jgi:hypothetical protein
MRGIGRGLFVHPRLWAHTRRAQTQINGRRRVGPGAGWWEQARIPGVDAWDRAQILRASATAAHMHRVQTQVNGRGRVGSGANIVSSRGRNAIHA